MAYPLVIQHSHGIDGPFIDDFPIKNLHLWLGCSMAMLVITRWELWYYGAVRVTVTVMGYGPLGTGQEMKRWII